MKSGLPYREYRGVLVDVILDNISLKQPRSSRQIIDLVIADYGSITERTLYRYLAQLLASGKIRVHHTVPLSGHKGGPQRFYVRAT